MKSILMPCLALLTLPAWADEQRVYTVDAYGNVTYGEPSFSVGKDGRIVEVDTYGNKQPHKTQYVVRNSRVYEADSYGRVQYQKPSYAVGKDGRVVQTDAYGNKGQDAVPDQGRQGLRDRSVRPGDAAEVRNQEQRFTFEVSRGETGGQVIDVSVACRRSPERMTGLTQ